MSLPQLLLQRIVVTASQVHDPSTPGGNVGSKATLGDLKGLKVGLTPDLCVAAAAVAVAVP
jgi:hypothetical protein